MFHPNLSPDLFSHVVNMWNIKQSAEEDTLATKPSKSSSPSAMFMNPAEITRNELMKKLKFFAAYIGGLVVVPHLLRSVGLLEPLAEIPLTRR
jgi:hypothetical protein